MQSYISTLLFQVKAPLHIYFPQQFLVREYYLEHILDACYIWTNPNILLCV